MNSSTPHLNNVIDTPNSNFSIAYLFEVIDSPTSYLYSSVLSSTFYLYNVIDNPSCQLYIVIDSPIPF